jgi:predicted TIM-barrel fold metal-dependent hydrolase
VLVDHHQHLFRTETIALVAPGASSSFQPLVAGGLLPLLDGAGMQRAVILSMGYTWGSPNRSVENEYEMVKAENDWTSEQVAEHPRRLAGFCGVNPLRHYALDEIERCSADPNLSRGLKLHFGNSAVDLLDRDHVGRVQRVFHAGLDIARPSVWQRSSASLHG